MTITPQYSRPIETLHPHLLVEMECRTIDDIALEPGWSHGVSVQSLEAGTVLTVHTRRSHYRLVVLESPRHVLLSGGALCPEPVEATLVGATASGSMVKSGWIGIGLRLELRVGRNRWTTSRVKNVTIDSIPREN